MRYLSVKPLKNTVVDNFIADNDLFAIFNNMPVNLIFWIIL